LQLPSKSFLKVSDNVGADVGQFDDHRIEPVSATTPNRRIGSVYVSRALSFRA